MNNGSNITNASTYDHMKITYFNPSQTTVAFADTATFGSSTFQFFPNGFTSADCATLTPSNSISVDIPASLVYVRDIRNKQTYRVKRMADNKCWMIDNLKYLDTELENADGTFGVFYNNRSTTNKYNTVNYTNTASAANYDKAFYNNPMGGARCYSPTNALNHIADGSISHCGYFYNWFAATNGSGTYSFGTNGAQASSSICPAGFRLPSGTSGSGGPTTTGTGTTTADLTVLNASMGAGTLSVGATTASLGENWTPLGAWSGAPGGYWDGMSSAGFSNQDEGYYWTSTANSSTGARFLRVFLMGPSVYPGTSSANKHRGSAVRCLLQAP